MLRVPSAYESAYVTGSLMILPVAFVIRMFLYYVTVHMCVRRRGRVSDNQLICMRAFKDVIISTLECEIVNSVNEPLIST